MPRSHDLPKPNFFIIGAPKCGTTALYTYLAAHPQVFMPAIKEPHYYATDFPGHQRVKSAAAYGKLFQACPANRTAIGEASVFYLYSQAAVANILREHPQARFIVMVRPPVDLAYSMHSQLLYGFEEDQASFDVAWDLQVARANGQQIPAGCPTPALLQYRALASVGEQLRRLLEQVSPERVLVISMSEFQSRTAACYQQVLEFLQVRHDGRTEFPRINQNKVHRSRWMARLVIRPPYPLNAVKSIARRLFDPWGTSEYSESRVGLWVYRLLTGNAPRPPISTELRLRLQNEFAADQRLLEMLLRQHWGVAHESTSLRRSA